MVRKFEGKTAWLRVSCFVAPFFTDPTRRLLSPAPTEETSYRETPGGPDLHPAAPEGIVRAGTRVLITQLEFPTVAAMGRRSPGTPRSNPWVLLEVEGQPRATPEVLVLPERIQSRDDALAEMEKYFSPEPVEPILLAFPESARRAIAEKRVVEKMDATAAEMAWGYPDRKTIVLKDGAREETWTYSSGPRRVVLAGGRVVRTEP